MAFFLHNQGLMLVDKSSNQVSQYIFDAIPETPILNVLSDKFLKNGF